MVKVFLRPVARRDLAKLGHALRHIILDACQDILDDWTLGKRLSREYSGCRVHRVGVYRIIYLVRESSRVEIVAIGHRKDVYERAKKQ